MYSLTEAVNFESLMFPSFKAAKNSNTVLRMMYITRNVGSEGRILAEEHQSPVQAGMAKSREGFLLAFRLSPI